MAAVAPQDSTTLLPNYLSRNISTRNVLVQEYAVTNKERPQAWWMKDLTIPRWLLTLFANLALLALIGFIILACVATLTKGIDGQSCRNSTDCRQDLGLICDNGRCSCQYTDFWNDPLRKCERQRSINQPCTSNSMCDSIAHLYCQPVILSGGTTQMQCQCQSGNTWNGLTCGGGLYNTPCLQSSNCDAGRYLMCDLSVGSSSAGRCRCNASMFWSGNANTGICEFKRGINQYCYPYRNDWCDDVSPLGQGLICAAHSTPYGSYYGVCQCDMYSFHNGTRCIPLRSFNEPCSLTSDCDYRLNLTCVHNLCTCPVGYGFNSTVNNSGIIGGCQPAVSYLGNCTSNVDCSASQQLICDLSYYGGTNQTGACACNGSWSYWDGTRCIHQLSIGGRCFSNSHCSASEGLFCSNYSYSLGTCDCDNDHYWNGTCIPKLLFNASCASQYECNGNRGLHCEGLGSEMFQRCDCVSHTLRWDSIYVANGSKTCVSKLSFGATCLGNYDCQDYNYLQCRNGTCLCDSMDFWDGSSCQPKRGYAYLCSDSAQCQNYTPINLLCRWNSIYSQCLCNGTDVWDECRRMCVSEKQINESCAWFSNCSSSECSRARNLTCMPTSLSNITGIGMCGCDGNMTWSGTACYSPIRCNGTCPCLPTEYFDGTQCVPKRNYLDPCFNTTECLDGPPFNLVCRTGPSGVLQCVCNVSSFWESCTQRCTISKKYLEPCISSFNCGFDECDPNANLKCINDSVINMTSTPTGWCNCTHLQWWNGSYCREKGVPAWGANTSALCNATYQCADYNLVSCPLGGSSLVRNATCECATTKYWNGFTCVDRALFGQPCTLWPFPPVNTSTCLSAAGVGLYCNSSICSVGTCTGGVCICPLGSVWNSTFSLCYFPPTTG